MKRDWSENAAIAAIYVSFFGLIGFAIWATGSAAPLWALLLTPSIKTSDKTS